MKRLITILVIMIVLIGAVFADAYPAAQTGNSSIDVTVKVTDIIPTVSLKGNKSAATGNPADYTGFTTEDELAYDDNAIIGSGVMTAYFVIQHTNFRWNKTLTVSVSATDLVFQGTAPGTATADQTKALLATIMGVTKTTGQSQTIGTKSFVGVGEAGYCLPFAVEWTKKNDLIPGNYKATVTATFTTD